jgi:uncharacterized membrane protein YsdA (DUF1294 family)
MTVNGSTTTPQHQSTGNSHRRRRADLIGLLTAIVVGLLINGFCVVRMLGDHGAAKGAPHAIIMVTLPFSAAVMWQWLLSRLARRRQHPSRPRHTLLVLAILLGATGVWIGESYVRTVRQSISALTTSRPAKAAARANPPQTIHTYYRLATTGALLQLSVVALGIALSRQTFDRETTSGSKKLA